MTFKQQQKVDQLVELVAKPSSNQNKYRHELYAYIDEITNANLEVVANRLDESGYHFGATTVRENKVS